MTGSDALHPSRLQGEEDERHCEHIREDGSRCKGWKAKDGSGLCAGHSSGFGRGGADPREAASRSAEARRGIADARSEARKLGLRDLLASRLEARADVIVSRLMNIVETGTDADALRAVDAMLSRVYGRPKESIEVAAVQAEPETVQALRAMTVQQRADLIRSLEEQGRIPLQLVQGD